MGVGRNTYRLIKVPEWFAEPERLFTTISSFVRSEFVSLAEAEAYANSLHVTAVYDANSLIANVANEFLTESTVRGIALPRTITVSSKAFTMYGNKARLIPAKTIGTAIHINPACAVWNDLVSASAQMYSSRFWSTPHPLHPLRHEAGHIMLDASQEPQRILTPRQQTLAAAVSSRAKQDQEEFVCEVFAGLLSGVEYDADIVRLYKRLKGRMP